MRCRIARPSSLMAGDIRQASGIVLQRKCACGQHTSAGGEYTTCREQRLDRKLQGAVEPAADSAVALRGLGGGRPLDPNLGAMMESHFNQHVGQLSPATAVTPQAKTILNQPHDRFEQEADSAANAFPPTADRGDDPTRPRGHDFSRVRIHTDSRAAQSARAFSAQAYTAGNHVVFAARQYAPHTLAGRRLLAHELTHVVQQTSAAAATAMIQRRVAPDYDEIQERLSYSVIDWAITDLEAREVLAMLGQLSDQDLAETVAAMDRDGLVERLLDNIATEDDEANAVLIARINRYRSVTHINDRINNLLTRGLFDWAITDDDARAVLSALRGMEPQQLRTVVARMVNNQSFDTLMDELPEEEHRRYAAFIARLRRIRDEFNALVTSHLTFLRRPADPDSGESGDAGARVRTRTDATGYGGSRATWPDLSDEQQLEWQQRAREAVTAVRTSVQGTDLEPIVSRSHFAFVPEEAERNHAFAYVSGGDTLKFGRSWVRNAESNPENVWQSIAHELGGHLEFGSTWAWELMRATLSRMTPDERRMALGSTNSLFSAYGYLETEIYAELRELPYRVAGSRGDNPASVGGTPGDVHDKLTKIRDGFGPEVGRQIVLRLYYRVLTDPRVSRESKQLLYTETQAVFGLFPIVEPLAP